MKLLRIKLPDQLHARLKVQAAMKATSMQAAGQYALLQWTMLCEEEQRPKNNPQPQPQKRGM